MNITYERTIHEKFRSPRIPTFQKTVAIKINLQMNKSHSFTHGRIHSFKLQHSQKNPTKTSNPRIFLSINHWLKAKRWIYYMTPCHSN